MQCFNCGIRIVWRYKYKVRVFLQQKFCVYIHLNFSFLLTAKLPEISTAMSMVPRAKFITAKYRIARCRNIVWCLRLWVGYTRLSQSSKYDFGTIKNQKWSSHWENLQVYKFCWIFLDGTQNRCFTTRKKLLSVKPWCSVTRTRISWHNV